MGNHNLITAPNPSDNNNKMKSFFFESMILLLATASPVESFVPVTRVKPSTEIRLEISVAEMIDREYERLTDHTNWRKKQQQEMRERQNAKIPEGFDFNSATDFTTTSQSANAKIQRRKDKRLARNDPAKYCADRCVSTGNCSVWEEFFDMDAEEVQRFCGNVCLARTKSLVMYLTGSLK